MKPIQIFEYGRIRSLAENNPESVSDLVIDARAFDDVWYFILEEQSKGDSIDGAFKLFTKNGKRIIQVQNYVGLIETKNKVSIEILPKIFKVEDYITSKRIFLKMLSTLKDTPFKTFQTASIDSIKRFPVIEIFIRKYIDEVELLLLKGLKKNYQSIEENSRYIKGQMLFSKDILNNIVDRSKFYIRHKVYTDNIPQNRLIRSTLRKLISISVSSENKTKLERLNMLFTDIPFSTCYNTDFALIENNNRLFADYYLVMEWSKVFLSDKGFTNFSGSTINQSLLFPMDRLFESYIAYLFKKYSKTHLIKAQHNQYYLVDKHIDAPRFILKPDIVAESANTEFSEFIIIDTKWKLIDESKGSKNQNYKIDIKDMYQLYAYGKKYSRGATKEPLLYLIYPQSETFTEILKPFYYEENAGHFHLQLRAIPFDLASISTYEDQICNILQNIEEYVQAQ